MEIKSGFIGNGVIILPRDDYDETNAQMEDLMRRVHALENDNLELRMMFADMQLPSPDAIDKNTLDVKEMERFTAPLDCRRRHRVIEFDYIVQPYDPKAKRVY